MAKNWYIYHNDEVMGPFPFEDLEGRLTPDTHVCPEDGDDWYRAGDIEGFEPALQPKFREDSASQDDSLGSSTDQTTSTSQQETSSTTTAQQQSGGSLDQDYQTGTSDEDGSTDQSDSSYEEVDEEQVDASDVEPTLDTLYNIAQQASDEDLVREYNEFWHEYDANEQKTIMNEIERRGINPATGEKA